MSNKSATTTDPSHKTSSRSAGSSAWQAISIVLSTLLVIGGALGLVYLQKPLRETQYIRPEASVDVGLVTISSRSTTGSMTQGVPSSVIFSVDTAGAQVHGIQLVFNVVTDAADNLGIKVLESSGLKTAFLETERTNDGYLVGVVALPQDESAGYSTTSAIDFLEIEFTPQYGGTIEFNFDVEESLASLFGSDPLKDELTHIETISYYVTGEPAATTSDTSTQPPPPDPNSVAQCNEVCSDNTQCPINHRCVDVSGTSRCRLATNISNEYCSTKITVESQQTASQTTFAQCNEQCSRHANCAAGFACLDGLCRHPQNPDNSSCQNPSETDLLTISQSCNTSCSQNSDCATNLRCFSGSCRLATNVSSTTCAAGYTGTVSSIYGESKGGDISDQQSGDNSPTQPGIGSGVSDELKTQEGQVTSTLDEIPPDETVWDMIKTMLATRELSLPLLILIAGSWLFILAVAWLIVRNIKDRAAKPKPLTPKVIDRSASEISSTSPILEVSNAQNSSSSSGSSEQIPVASSPTPPTSSPAPAPISPTPAEKPATPPAQSPGTPKSSMMQRVRDKGISPPSQKTQINGE